MATNKDILVAAIGYGHLSTVALMKNGELVFALSEERLRRIKNYVGFPHLAYAELLKRFCSGNPDAIDSIILPTNSNQEYAFYIESGKFDDGRYFDLYRKTESNSVPDFFLNRTLNTFDAYIRKDREEFENLRKSSEITERAIQFYEKQTLVPRTKIRLLDHHLAHAYSTLLFLPEDTERRLIFTLDGCGDNLCASVSLNENGAISRLATCDRYASPGRFFREVTAFLGLRPDEDEFKVMGLAAYSRRPDYKHLLEKFVGLIRPSADSMFFAEFPMEFTKWFLLQNCVYERFDHLAAAAQAALEVWVTHWIRAWIRRTEIQHVSLSGGVFMNIKLNQRILELSEIESLSVVPSAGDESNPLGACVYGSVTTSNSVPIKRLYNLGLGLDAEDAEVERELNLFISNGAGLEVKRTSNIAQDTATILASGHPVAWVQGRCEWGARGLGARSLLADPRNISLIKVLNDSIKSRDFWMPFAPSIIAEDFSKYVVNPKGYEALFMNMSFDSTTAAWRDLGAALHQYDLTCRPQLVSKHHNPLYYELISRFREITGVGALLNTSLNMHGEPIVNSATDALNLLMRSKLNYLALGSYLVTKIDHMQQPRTLDP